MHIKLKNDYYTHTDKTFLIVELFIAITCIFIPVILFLVNGKLLSSISAYVNMNYPHIFGILLTMASMMFLFNGALYFKAENDVQMPSDPVRATDIALNVYNKKEKSKWYNLVLGIALLGVAFVPYDKIVWLHYFFAGLFFVGSAIIIFLIHDPRDRMINRIMAVASVIALIIPFFIEYYAALFWAETFALVIIGIHYILESRRIWLRSAHDN